jgi:hypothetical protein
VAGYDNAIHVSFTVPAGSAKQISAIEYGINAAAETGTFAGPFTAGALTEAITSAMTGKIANGTPVTVYLAACNNAGQCSAWTGPSNQVTPYGPPAKPNAAATANGNQITFTWSANGGNGRALAGYSVCIDGACTNQAAAGTKTVTYGYGETHTLSVTVTDSAGQKSPAANAQATTGAAPPPAGPPTLTISEGADAMTRTPHENYYIHLAVTNFPANSVVTYSCATTNTGLDGLGGINDPGGSYSTDSSGATVRTDAAGSASFDSAYYMVWVEYATFSCTSNGVTKTYTVPPMAGASITIVEGTDGADFRVCNGCSDVHLSIADFPASTAETYTCAASGSSSFFRQANPSTGSFTTDANGRATVDTGLGWTGWSGNDSVTCTSDGSTGTYTGSGKTAIATISQGQPVAGQPGTYHVHLVLSNFFAYGPVVVFCGSATDNGSSTTDASGSDSFDSTLTWNGFATSGSTLSCQVNTYTVGAFPTYTTP